MGFKGQRAILHARGGEPGDEATQLVKKRANSTHSTYHWGYSHANYVRKLLHIKHSNIVVMCPDHTNMVIGMACLSRCA